MARGEGDELITRARDGDERAWAVLYADHAERLVVWLRHLQHLDAAFDAEDIAAEAWLTAAQRLPYFTGDRRDFAGWLFGIARNISRSRYRRALNRATTPLDPEYVETVRSVDDHAGRVASVDLTRWLIAQLPEREAQVVACIDVVGLDVASTCHALDMRATAVRVAHHRGLRRLSRLLSRSDTTAIGVTLRSPEGM